MLFLFTDKFFAVSGRVTMLIIKHYLQKEGTKIGSYKKAMAELY